MGPWKQVRSSESWLQIVTMRQKQLLNSNAVQLFTGKQTPSWTSSSRLISSKALVFPPPIPRTVPMTGFALVLFSILEFWISVFTFSLISKLINGIDNVVNGLSIMQPGISSTPFWFSYMSDFKIFIVSIGWVKILCGFRSPKTLSNQILSSPVW